MSKIDYDEINRLKAIDIRIFLEAMGWSHDRKSGRNAYTDGTRTVHVKEKASGGWIATDFDGDGKGKSILDIAFDRPEIGNGNWRGALDLLRSIIGTETNSSPSTKPSSSYSSPVSPNKSFTSPVVEIKKTHAEIAHAWRDNAVTWRSGDPIPDYLFSRGIGSLSSAFDGSFTVSQSGSGNLRFVCHAIEDGAFRFAGVERRGPNAKGFYTKDSLNGVWISNTKDRGSRTIFVAESQIDAMSHDILHPDAAGRIYMCVRSGAEDICIEAIKRIIDKGWCNKVVMITDNDPAGMLYAAKVMKGLRRKDGVKGYHGDVTAYYLPPDDHHEDWNDALKASLGMSAEAPEFMHEISL